MNRLQPGVFVSGPYGDLIETISSTNNSGNAEGNVKKSSKKRRRLNGVIREAIGERRWVVVFEDGSVKSCPSSRLKFISCHPPVGVSIISSNESMITNAIVAEAVGYPTFVPQNESNELMMDVVNNDAVVPETTEQQLNDVVTQYTVETVNDDNDDSEFRENGLDTPYDLTYDDNTNDDDIILDIDTMLVKLN